MAFQVARWRLWVSKRTIVYIFSSSIIFFISSVTFIFAFVLPLWSSLRSEEQQNLLSITNFSCRGTKIKTTFRRVSYKYIKPTEKSSFYNLPNYHLLPIFSMMTTTFKSLPKRRQQEPLGHEPNYPYTTEKVTMTGKCE